MEEPGGTHFDSIKNTVRKRRSQTCRRRRPDSQVALIENYEYSPPVSSTLSDDVSKVSSDDTPAFDTNPRRKQFSLSQCMSRAASVSESQSENYDSRRRGLNSNNRRSTEGLLAPANWKSASRVKEGLELDFQGNNNDHSGRNGESLDMGESGNEGKVKKVKLKVGGVTCTIQTNGGTGDGSSRKNSRALVDSRSRMKPNLQGNSDDCNSPQDNKSSLQGVLWKDFSLAKEGSSMGKMAVKNGKQGEATGQVRKSKRVPKRRVLDGEFSEEDDDEIRYLEKLKSKAYTVYKEDDEESLKKQRKNSRISTAENVGKRKSRSEMASIDMDYEEEEEEELVSDNEIEGNNKNNNKKQKKESVESLMENDNKREMTLTTRQRALQSSKDPSSARSNLIEFPNGLPAAPPRKQKEKPSEVEQQLKKAEAAQRRRIQNEKAARESEAEAIRKILGQDSSRKKREDKIKKRREELAQEKAEHERMVGSSYIRTVMGPNGTSVTFPEDMGFPSLFDPKPSRYPPPREKCAGPSCTNPYKYRDSKTKLPLCSLQCYKAVQQESVEAEATC